MYLECFEWRLFSIIYVEMDIIFFIFLELVFMLGLVVNVIYVVVCELCDIVWLICVVGMVGGGIVWCCGSFGVVVIV